MSFREFDVVDDLFAHLCDARDSLVAYLFELVSDPTATAVTHPIPTFMAFACAGFLVISRNGPAR